MKPVSQDLRVLFCFEGLLPSSVSFKHNHYVPLISSDVAKKMKSISFFPKSKNHCSTQSKLSFQPSVSNNLNEAKTVFPKLPPSSGVVYESAPTDLFVNISSTSVVTSKSATTLLNTVVSSAPKQAVISSGSKLVSSLLTSTIPIHYATLEHENEFDIAFFRQKVKGMKNSEIEELIKNVFVPDKF